MCEENDNYEVPSAIIIKLTISPQAMWSIIKITKKKSEISFFLSVLVFQITEKRGRINCESNDISVDHPFSKAL